VSSGPIPHLSVEQRNLDHAVVLEVRGDLDMATRPALARRIDDVLDTTPPRLVVDLAGLAFIDSSGIDALVTARARAEKVGVPFALASPSRACRRILDITGVADLFTIEP
jgi:anti-sigma B factor antagonist